jgi:hypothetical protein
LNGYDPQGNAPLGDVFSLRLALDNLAQTTFDSVGGVSGWDRLEPYLVAVVLAGAAAYGVYERRRRQAAQRGRFAAWDGPAPV